MSKMFYLKFVTQKHIILQKFWPNLKKNGVTFFSEYFFRKKMSGSAYKSPSHYSHSSPYSPASETSSNDVPRRPSLLQSMRHPEPANRSESPSFQYQPPRSLSISAQPNNIHRFFDDFYLNVFKKYIKKELKQFKK